jgi:hypothetical protein
MLMNRVAKRRISLFATEKECEGAYGSEAQGSIFLLFPVYFTYLSIEHLVHIKLDQILGRSLTCNTTHVQSVCGQLFWI